MKNQKLTSRWTRKKILIKFIMYLELKQSDINKLILQYLKNNDFPFTYFTFSKETQDDNFQYLNHKLEDIILKGLTYLYLESHD